MSNRGAVRATVSMVAALLGLAVLPAVCAAVLAGENGRIVFVSGRTSGDAAALIHFLPVPFSSGGGTVGPPITPPGGQYRHPTWSPDRTMIAYANGAADNNPATQNFDIYVQDVANGGGPIPITNIGDSLSADRPAWSPDGTRIAYEHQPVDNSTDRNIRVQPANDLQPPFTVTEVANTAAFEGKPAWDPASNSLYYGITEGGDLDIVREAADGLGTPTTILGANGSDQYQPSISPDGSKLCFTQQSTPGDLSTANVFVARTFNPGGLVTISAQAASEYNCTWSPDGQKIAYVSGAFSAGALMMQDSDGLGGLPDTLAEDPGANEFDGNPDWAPDGRPVCPDSTVTTTVNQPVTISLACTDTGPAYEQTDVKEFPGTQPTNGTADQDLAGEPITYTPNQDFTGTDSFEVRSFDGFGFGLDTGTVTITVNPAQGGGDGGGDPNADTTPPDTTIDKQPRKKTEKQKAKFKFSATEPGSTFECKFDTRKYKPCSSPRKYKRLDPGKHKFRVRATDAAGNRDPSPAKHRWTVLDD